MKQFLIVVTFVLGCVSAYAQSAASFLEINPDPVVQGIGGVSVTSAPSAFSFWNNSSMAALSESKIDAGLSYCRWQPSKSNMISAGTYFKVAQIISLSAGIKFFGYPKVDVCDDYGKVINSISPKDFSLGVGIAFKIAKKFAVSANLNYLNSNLGYDNAKSGGISTDFAATCKLEYIRVAITVSNIGSRLNYDNNSYWGLPANAKIGFGGSLGSEKHAVDLDLQGGCFLSGSSFFASAGAQYTYNDLLSFRVGYHYGDSLKYIPQYASVGIGLSFKWFCINGAYLITSQNNPIRNTFLLSSSVKF